MTSSNNTIGAIPAPPGVTPNFANPESIAWEIVLAAALSATIATSVYLVRVYTSYFILKRWYLDDGFIAVALVFAIAFSIINIVQTKLGVGTHLWDIPLSNDEKILKLGVIGGSITYNLATLFTKVSILLFYLRFASELSFKITTYLVMFVTVGYSLTQAFSFLYICSPIARYWDSSVAGSCVNANLAYVVTAGLNSAADITILLLPIWLLWPLRIETRQKTAATLLLMTGGFVSVVRLANILVGLPDPDFTWRGYLTNQIWSLLEMYTGIVCACLPCLKPLARHHFPRLFSTNRTQIERALTFKSIPRRRRQSSSVMGNSRLQENGIQLHERPVTTDSLTGFISEQQPPSISEASELDDVRRHDRPVTVESCT